MDTKQLNDSSSKKGIKKITFSKSQIVTLLTVIALILSAIQMYQANKFTESISTRYIGEFPGTLKNINALLHQAKSDVIIFQDVSTFGAYSNPSEFHEYLSTIRSLADHNVNITLVVYHPKLRERTREKQFIGSEKIREYEKLKKTNKKYAYFKRDSIFMENMKEKGNLKVHHTFLNYSFGQENINKHPFIILDKIKEIEKKDSLTYTQHYAVLDSMNHCIENNILKNDKITIEYVRSRHIMNCWLIDNHKAIFGYPSGYNNANEIAFITQDGNIIEYILKMYKELPISKNDLELDLDFSLNFDSINFLQN
jgi:hypothetical protein